MLTVHLYVGVLNCLNISHEFPCASAASLIVIKGIIRCTNAFLSSGQGADTRALLNWEIINGFGEISQ